MINLLKAETLEALAKIIGDTANGYTGSQIEMLLKKAGLPDSNPDITKWKRVFNSFIEYSNTHKNCSSIIKSVELFLNPTRYINNMESFEYRRSEIIKVLAFEGLFFDESNNLRETQKVTSFSKPYLCYLIEFFYLFVPP